MKNRKYFYIFVVCSFFSITNIYSTNNTEKKQKKYIYLLDNKPVSEIEIEKKMKKEEIVLILQVHTPREAVAKLGEKYREPVIVYETKNN